MKALKIMKVEDDTISVDEKKTYVFPDIPHLVRSPETIMNN